MAIGLALGCATAPIAPEAIPPIEAQPRARGAFDLLTYNVAGLPAGLSGSDPAENHALISPLLARYDLVLLQEDFGYWHDDLVAESGHDFVSEPKRPTRAPVGDGLSRLSRYPWTDHQRVQWPTLHGVRGSGSDALSEKGFDVSRVRVAAGVEIVVYGLHADAGGSTADHESRRDGFAALAEHITTHAGDAALIVAGDFNLSPGSTRGAAILATLQSVTGLRDVGLDMVGDRGHIDRVLYRSGGGIELSPTQWRIADEFVDEQRRPLSDHPAIQVRFEWSAPRSPAPAVAR